MVDAGDVNGCREADSELVVAGGEAAVVFEVVEAALDGVPVLVGVGVEGRGSATGPTTRVTSGLRMADHLRSKACRFRIEREGHLVASNPDTPVTP